MAYRRQMGANSNILLRLLNTRMLPAFLVPLITLLGLLARLRHIFNFYIYPDSYYYLLIADNLRRHGVAYGTLGAKGMHFPPVGSAILKPAFPFFVSVVDRFVDNLELSGHIVAVGASVLTIPIAFFLARRLFDSVTAGVAAAALIAVSYNHIYWSGFLMGDSLAVLLMFASLLFLLREDKPDYANPYDFLAGIAVALALLSRLTYAATIPALAWLMVTEFAWSKERIATALSGSLFVLSAAALLILPPFPEILRLLVEVSSIILVTIGLLAVAAGVMLIGRRYSPGSGRGVNGRLARLGLTAALVLPGVLWLVSIAVSYLPGRSLFPGLLQFVSRDKLLAVAYLGGVVALAASPGRRLATVCAVNVLVLVGLYYQVASWETRYLTHLLPFIVLPAAYGLAYLADGLRVALPERRSMLAYAAASVLLILSAFSVRDSLTPSKGIFLKTSYHREVSRLARPTLSAYHEDSVLLAVLSWPYYFHLRLSSWSIDVEEPGRMLSVLPNEGKFLIVSDAPLRQYLPSLAGDLAKSKSAKRVVGFSVSTPYQSPGDGVSADKMVSVYELDAPALRRVLSSAGSPP